MKRIVVGVGQSDAGRHALEWAAALATATGAELVGVTASPYEAFEFAELKAIVEGTAQADLEAWAAPELGPDVRYSTEVIDGDPRVVLNDVQQSLDPGLLVVGRCGPGAEPGLLHVNSVAEYLAHHARVPLAVVTDTAPTRPGRIAVGVDGSANGHRAAAFAAELALATGAAVTAISVHEPFLEWTPESDRAAWHEQAEQAIRDDLAVELTDAGVDLTPVAVRGRRPADGLLHAATGSDLLVVGLRGAGGFPGLHVGGVAMSVLHAASCSVVLVPPTGD